MSCGPMINKHPLSTKTILTSYRIFFFFLWQKHISENKIQCLRQTNAAHLSCFNGLRSRCNHRVLCLHTCGFHNLGRRTDGGWVKWLVSGVAGSDLDRVQHNTLDGLQIITQYVLHVEKSTAKTLSVKNRKRHCETMSYDSDTNKDKFRLDRYVYQCSSWYRLLVRR